MMDRGALASVRPRCWPGGLTDRQGRAAIAGVAADPDAGFDQALAIFFTEKGEGDGVKWIGTAKVGLKGDGGLRDELAEQVAPGRRAPGASAPRGSPRTPSTP